MTTATIMLALALAPAQSDAVTLKWNLKEGDEFYSRTVQVMDMTMGFGGQNREQKQETTTTVRFKIKSAKANETVIEMTTVAVDMKAAMPGAGNIGEKMKGLTFTLTLDKDMRVTKLEGYDKFIDAIASDDLQKKLMQTAIPESTFSRMASQTFEIAPGKPIRPGETWDRNATFPMGPLGNFDLKQTFQLDKVTDGVAKIGVNVDMTFKPGGGGLAGLPVKITKMDLKAEKFTGTQLFDINAGRLKEATSDGTMNGNMTMNANGQDIKMDLKMKMKMKQTTTVTTKNPNE